ncbi:MAG: hypothetical protein H7Z74_15295 [Anaerolineae bacterium]|nr:hypothetical protein [Gemmatimonadaceae bacterium]
MPSAGDFYNQMQASNARLDAIRAELTNGFSNLATLHGYTNDALLHNAKQNDTIICLLTQIAENTCCVCNEAHIQTGLQTSIKADISSLAALYALGNAQAALAWQRELALKKQIEECCPPDGESEPACTPKPCPAPRPLPDPPHVGPGVILRQAGAD